MAQDGAGDDVGGGGAAAADGGFDEGHAAVGVEVGDDGVAHGSELVEAFFVGADEEDGDFVVACGSRAGSLGGGLAVSAVGFGGVHEADVHVQIAIFIETREAERDPVLAAAGFDPVGFEEHVEY